MGLSLAIRSFTDPYVSYANYIDNGQNPAPNGCTPSPPFASTACKSYDKYKPLVVPPINYFKGWGMAATIDWNMRTISKSSRSQLYRYYTNIFANDDDVSPLAVQELFRR